MRLNVYAEEVTGETELVTKQVEQEGGELVTFYGVRMFLDSPPSLHHNKDDDDRSAITIWVPWTKSGGNNFNKIDFLLANLVKELDLAQLTEQRLTNGI